MNRKWKYSIIFCVYFLWNSFPNSTFLYLFVCCCLQISMDLPRAICLQGNCTPLCCHRCRLDRISLYGNLPCGRKGKEKEDFEGMHSDLLLSNEWSIYWKTANARQFQNIFLMDETIDSTTNWIWNTIHVLLNRWLTQRQDFKCLQLTRFFCDSLIDHRSSQSGTLLPLSISCDGLSKNDPIAGHGN